MRKPFEKILMKFTLDLASRSTCNRKKVAAVLVSEDFNDIYAYSYNGGIPGDLNKCDNPKKPGNCGCLCAELNALMKARKDSVNKTLFITLSPCLRCAKLIINFREIKNVYFHDWYRKTEGLKILVDAKINCEQI